MGNKAELTKARIKEVAKHEFLDKGFENASLRTIAVKAGVTTGAIYGYFNDKETLFASLVDKVYNFFLKQFDIFTEEFFSNTPDDASVYLLEKDVEYLNFFIDYMYQNPEESKLLICCSEGTKYSNLIDLIVSKNERSSRLLLERFGKGSGVEINDHFLHIISSSYFKAIFETIEHDLSYEEAKQQCHLVYKFFTSGWSALLS